MKFSQQSLGLRLRTARENCELDQRGHLNRKLRF